MVKVLKVWILNMLPPSLMQSVHLCGVSSWCSISMSNWDAPMDTWVCALWWWGCQIKCHSSVTFRRKRTLKLECYLMQVVNGSHCRGFWFTTYLSVGLAAQIWLIWFFSIVVHDLTAGPDAITVLMLTTRVLLCLWQTDWYQMHYRLWARGFLHGEIDLKCQVLRTGNVTNYIK